ncbi:hypothetical protein MOQ_001227 [Trypanosoma cruzi marinkellei]|uniref:Uncharacterized protein n=1 Tax=Trypanosoma cruzi marinkellei TaxID=85056 RepID=K2NGT4_TRYCR|nr:hypothetical protein MOQ_001227 [Trypanosoma cruzi marinkellei]
MSEVLLLLSMVPASNSGGSENLSMHPLSASRSLHLGGATFREGSRPSVDDFQAKCFGPHQPPLHEEERHQRMLIMLECKLEFMTLVMWCFAIKMQIEKELLRGRKQSVQLQESTLRHRMARFAHVEDRFGHPVKNPTCRLLLQDEFFEREHLALQETAEFLDVWAKMIPARISMIQGPAFFAEVMASLRSQGHAAFFVAPNVLGPANSDKRLSKLRKTVRDLKSDLAAIRSEAEVLSFAMDEELREDVAEITRNDMKEGEESELAAGRDADYCANVMRLATKQMDELRGSLFRLTEKLQETEQSLTSTKRSLLDEKERSAHLQQILNATEEMAASVASQCQLGSSRANSSAQHEDVARQPGDAPSTYTKGVLQELRRSMLMLTKEVDWQKERTQKGFRERDAVLEMVYTQVEKLAALMPPSHFLNELKRENINMTNIASIMEEIIAGVMALKNDRDRSCVKVVQTPQTGPQEGEVAAMKATIEQLRSTIELLLSGKGKAGDDRSAVASAAPPVPVVNSQADVLTMALRRLEEVRGEEIKLAQELEEMRRNPRLAGWRSRHGIATPESEEEAEHNENMWVQSVHRLSEANTLLQEELRLEREAGQSLRTKLKESERFITELQKQCRRLRLSGRIDVCEVIEQSGSDRDDDDEEEDSDDSDGDSTARMPFEEKKQREMTKNAEGMGSGDQISKEFYAQFCSPHSTELTETSRSLGSLMRPLGLSHLIDQENHMACVRDQQRLVKALCGMHGIKLATLLMGKGSQGSSCNLHEMSNVFIACSISLHTFFKGTGASAQVLRHVAVIYPLPSNEMPCSHLRRMLHPLKYQRGASSKENNGPSVEVFDLCEEFQTLGRYLRGCMDVCFSQDGRFMYALTSADSTVIARLCSAECLNIPEEHQFRFSGSLPKGMTFQGSGSAASGNGNGTMTNNVMDTGDSDPSPLSIDMLGWCGRGGICAWALDCMQFDSAAERARFERHLKSEYRLVLRLSAKEVQRFVGGSVELMGLTVVGRTVARLVMSLTAYEALSSPHRAQILQWYGGPQGILLLNVMNIESLTGAPLRRLLAMVHWHGRWPFSKTLPRETLERFGFQLHQKQQGRP